MSKKNNTSTSNNTLGIVIVFLLIIIAIGIYLNLFNNKFKSSKDPDVYYTDVSTYKPPLVVPKFDSKGNVIGWEQTAAGKAYTKAGGGEKGWKAAREAEKMDTITRMNNELREQKRMRGPRD